MLSASMGVGTGGTENYPQCYILSRERNLLAKDIQLGKKVSNLSPRIVLTYKKQNKQTTVHVTRTNSDRGTK